MRKIKSEADAGYSASENSCFVTGSNLHEDIRVHEANKVSEYLRVNPKPLQGPQSKSSLMKKNQLLLLI